MLETLLIELAIYATPFVVFTLIVGTFVHLCVKMYRCHRWYEQHDGVQIGSEEFFDWCRKEGVSSSLFI